MNIGVSSRSATLRIIMARKFDEFGQSERDGFIHGLSKVTGCEVKDMSNIRFRSGCVVAEVRMPENAVNAFLEFLAKAESGDLPSSLSSVASFLREQKVKSANADFDVALQIRVKHAPKQELVFLHGWTGDSTTFGALPKFLGESLNCKTWRYEYPTGWLSHSPSIYFVAQNLDNWFRNYLTADRVGIIVHSMGGVIARTFLTIQRDRREPLDDRVQQATFIASPHDGSGFSGILSSIGLGSPQIEELSKNSGFIADLKTRWGDWVAKKDALGTRRVRSIYGTLDKIVSIADAMGLDPEAVPILGAGHRDIVKPAGRDAEIVLTVERFLREAGFSVTGNRAQDTPPKSDGSGSPGRAS